MHHFGGLQWEDRFTGVIFHYLNRLLTFVSKFNTTKFVFTWDSRKNKRKEIYSGYKNKDLPERTPAEDELWVHCFEQIYQLRKNILPTLGFKNVFIQTGYEADDIIADIVLNDCYVDYIVVSGDNDLYQLLGSCRMWDLGKKKFYTAQDFIKEYDIMPELWSDVKTYAGCPGDKVPGIEGIGLTRAIQYEKGQLKGEWYNTIRFAPEEWVEMNRTLVTLPLPGVDTPQLDFDEHFDLDNIFSICEDYGLFSLLKGQRLKTWKEFAK
jgi:5'-3' exonuclease